MKLGKNLAAKRKSATKRITLFNIFDPLISRSASDQDSVITFTYYFSYSALQAKMCATSAYRSGG